MQIIMGSSMSVTRTLRLLLLVLYELARCRRGCECYVATRVFVDALLPRLVDFVRRLSFHLFSS